MCLVRVQGTCAGSDYSLIGTGDCRIPVQLKAIGEDDVLPLWGLIFYAGDCHSATHMRV